jgi:hypothetical protein
MANFFTIEKISENREITPEGYLLCRNCPVARIGKMIYLPSEVGDVGVTVDSDGFITVDRFPEDVFSDSFLDSLNLKPVTNDHPAVDVDPSNYKNFSVGVGTNPRRGEGELSDYLLMDLLIQDGEVISLIHDGKVEISLGYRCDIVPTDDPFIGKQVNLIGNHIAVVEKGRCGPNCKIVDSQEKILAKEEGFVARFKKFLKDEGMEEAKADDELPDNEGKKDEAPDFKDALDAITAKFDAMLDEFSKRLDALEAANNKEDCMATDDVADPIVNAGDEDAEKTEDADPEGDEAKDADPEGDKAEDEDPEGDKTEDADPEGLRDAAPSMLDREIQSVLSGAEIIAPGIEYPSTIRDGDLKSQVKALCDFRRHVLTQGFTRGSEAVITSVTQKTRDDILGLSCPEVKLAFDSVAAFKAEQNTAAIRNSVMVKSKDGKKVDAPKTAAELSAFYKNFWKN